MSDANKKTVRVTIFNQTYTLRSSGDPGETEQVARAVDQIMRSIAAQSGSGDSTRAAVLACMHLADQLQGMQKDLDALKQGIARQAARLNELLDEV